MTATRNSGYTVRAIPTWSINSGTLTCSGCHNAGSTLATGKHARHTGGGSNYSFGCADCHSATASGNNSISSVTNHVNRRINVDLASTWGGSYSANNHEPDAASGTCSANYCHSDGKATGITYSSPSWAGNSLDCLGCHGNSTSNTLSGKHQAHVNNDSFIGTNFGCADCHALTVNDNFTISNRGRHVNKMRDYSGVRAGRNAACSNIYCHSNGKGGFVTPGTWSAGAAIDNCKGCHGSGTGSFTSVAGEPNYANAGINQPLANSHQRHVGNNGAITCDTCHTQTTTSGTAILSGSTLHLNGNLNVTFNTMKSGTGAQYLNRTCSNVICHGNNNVAWGDTLSCGNCHLGTYDDDDYTYNNGRIAKIKLSGEWDTTGHGSSVAYASGRRAAAFIGTEACLYCHDVNINHGVSGNVFRLRNIVDITWGKNGVCMNCHQSGSLGISINSVNKNADSKITSYHYGSGHSAQHSGGQFCWDCHDPHGDSNLFMIHGNVAVTSDSATSLPGTTAATVFTSFNSGSSYARTSEPFNGICNVCHTSTGHYTANSGDGHNSGSRCTDCHGHSNAEIRQAFAAGESTGGKNCSTCHKDRYAADQNSYSMHSNIAQISYKHYMTNDSPTYSTLLPGGTSQNPEARRCTMCHVDHDFFRVPASATAGRAFNLRPDATKVPTRGINTDLTMCATCHFQVWGKAIPTPNNDSTTMPIPFPNVTYQNATTIVRSSTHGYQVRSQDYADATLGYTSFQAVCVKCHNDTIGKNGGPGEGNKSSMNGQDGTASGRYKFGQHQGNMPNFYSVFSSNFFQGAITSYSAGNKSITVAGANWSSNQWASYYVIVTAGAGQNQREMVISGNTSNTIYLKNALSVPLDQTSVMDIAQFPVSHDNICFSCHSQNGQEKSNGAGKDWYGVQPMKPEIESIKNLFIADQGVTTATDSGGTNDAPMVIDSSKSWTSNQWTNYNVRFESGAMKGQVRKVASNSSNTLVLYTARQLQTRIDSGTRYRIYKPAMHQIDTYGRHKTVERVNPTPGSWNMGDTGVDTVMTGPTTTSTITDKDRYWKANQWQGLMITFPARNGLKSTINGNTETSVTFTPAQTLDRGEPYYIGNRHVSCTDCHNSHAALDHPSGTVTSADTNTLTSGNAINPRWTVDQWKGYLIKVRQFTGSTDNGREQIRYITGFNPASGIFTVSIPWNTGAFTINGDDQFLVLTNDKWTPVGQDGGRAGEGSSAAGGLRLATGRRLLPAICRAHPPSAM